ncbi:MAG: sigma-70 family RNA polymerase sigma factor, partial [Ruminiclostridium sp.]|nr:sigma-70 family RNA polymerase sigma factor [Ruminiclostridium sp.]
MLSLYLSLVDNEEQRTLVEQIYSDCEQIMYRTAYSILHNKQDAEDAVHDAFLRIVSDIDRIASVDPGKRRNYAVIVAKNIAIDHYRKNKKQVDIEDVPEYADEETDVERSAFGEYDAAAL